MEDNSRTYAIALDGRTYIVRAKTNKQAVNFIANREAQRVRDLASCRVATFEDGLEAERHGIQTLDATGGAEDSSQLDLGV